MLLLYDCTDKVTLCQISQNFLGWQPLPTYIYVRMSSKISAMSGISEESQLRVCNSYRSIRGLDLGSACYPVDAPSGCFIDRGVSGRTRFDERPAGKALLNCLKPGDSIIFYNVERAFRSVRYWANTISDWLNAGVTPHFAQQSINLGTATGTLMGNMLAAMAQYYADIISQRIREAHAIRRALNLPKQQKEESRKWENSTVLVYTDKITEQDGLRPGVIRIYNRVSHIDQKLSGLGMDVQRGANSRFAEFLMGQNDKLTLVDAYEDESVSAFKLSFEERPAGRRLIDDVKKGDHVVIYRTDRAFRHPAQVLKLVELLARRGAILHLVDEGISSNTEMGKLWIHLLATFASIESQIKRERNKEISDNQKKNGRPCNSEVPYYARVVKTKEGKKYAYDREQITVLAMADLLNRYGYSHERIENFMYWYEARRRGEKFNIANQYGWNHKAYRRFKQLRELFNKWNNPRLTELIYGEAWDKMAKIPISKSHSFDDIKERVARVTKKEAVTIAANGGKILDRLGLPIQSSTK